MGKTLSGLLRSSRGQKSTTVAVKENTLTINVTSYMFMCWQNQKQILKYVISKEIFETLNARECPRRSIQTTTH